eukprot:g555.t1
MFTFEDRVVVITGAAMGMGKSLALKIAALGCRGLALCDVDLGALEEVKREIERMSKSVKVRAYRVDVGDADDLDRFSQDVDRDFGVVHVLYNNAGIVVSKAFDRMSRAEFDRVINIDLNGVINCTRSFWPLLMKAAPEKAVVVNTSSVAGFFPPAAGISTPYAVAKYGVRGFSEHMGVVCKDIAPHIRFVCVHPGAINTEIPRKNLNLDFDKRFFTARMLSSERKAFESMTNDEQYQYMKDRAAWLFEKWGYSSDAAAQMIIDGTISGNTRVMVGWDAVIMDWWVRLLPRIFMSEAGKFLVGLTSVVGRHFYVPLAVLFTALAIGRRYMRSSL